MRKRSSCLKASSRSRTDFGTDGYGGPCPPPAGRSLPLVLLSSWIAGSRLLLGWGA